MTLTSGQLLQSRYRILRQLGQGGMGAVYLAEDGRLGRQCAIKESVPDPAASPQALAQMRQQFQMEARTLASLDHPNLTKVYDFFSDAGNEYIVMDYVEGKDLAGIQAQHGGPLPEKPVLLWADQVLDALEYLHGQRPNPIIHRDIKPANLILTAQGKIKLVDFGLVKLFDPSNPRTATIIQGMGTPEYTPLEQYPGGVVHTDPRSDIYSLGATLCHLLTGQTPPIVRDRLLDPSRLAPPRQLNPALTAGIEAAILRAVEIQPLQRFQTAHEMRQALVAARSSTPVLPPFTPGAVSPVPASIPLTPTPASGSPVQAPVANPQMPIPISANPVSAPKKRHLPTPWIMGILAAVVLIVMVLIWPPAPPGIRFRATATILPVSMTLTLPAIITAAPTRTSTVTASPSASPTKTPTVTPSATPLPKLRLEQPFVNLRTGPGLNYPVVGIMRQGEMWEVTGKDANGEWWQGVYKGQLIWVSNTVVPVGTPGLGLPKVAAPPAPSPNDGATLTWLVDGMTLVYVSAGQFPMGAAEADAFAESAEKPQHKIYLSSYWIDRTEVTTAMYAQCVQAGACEAPRNLGTWSRKSYYNDVQFSNYPAVYVSWDDAQAYCVWVGRRLPTEAEWEKAARGVDGRKYPWGNQTHSGQLLNFCDDRCLLDWKDPSVDGYADTSPIGNYPTGASPYGAWDMAGNAWEWVSDWYNSGYYAGSPAQNPSGPAGGDQKVLRGGSWKSDQLGIRTTYRYKSNPAEASLGDVGFRCARSQ